MTLKVIGASAIDIPMITATSIHHQTAEMGSLDQSDHLTARITPMIAANTTTKAIRALVDALMPDLADEDRVDQKYDCRTPRRRISTVAQ
jgi:hypothetical protein